MLASFFSKTKECEKGERGKDKCPAGYLQTPSHLVVVLPNETRNLADPGIVAVRVVPAYPGCDALLRIRHNNICSERDGNKCVHGSQNHQAEVAAFGEPIAGG
jgi:hypothetical protein